MINQRVTKNENFSHIPRKKNLKSRLAFNPVSFEDRKWISQKARQSRSPNLSRSYSRRKEKGEKQKFPSFVNRQIVRLKKWKNFSTEIETHHFWPTVKLLINSLFYYNGFAFSSNIFQRGLNLNIVYTHNAIKRTISYICYFYRYDKNSEFAKFVL